MKKSAGAARLREDAWAMSPSDELRDTRAPVKPNVNSDAVGKLRRGMEGPDASPSGGSDQHQILAYECNRRDLQLSEEQRRSPSFQALNRQANQTVELMDCLPSELIADIFICGADSFALNQGRLRFLIDISAVTARWRAIATSTPRLWSSITVTPYVRGHANGLGRLQSWTEPVEAAVERSANVLLTIRVHTGRSLPQAIRALWDVITPVLWRCEYLEIHGSYSTLNTMFPLHRPCPQLRELHIYPIMRTRATPPPLLFAPDPISTEPSPPFWAPTLHRLNINDVLQSSFLSSIPSSTLLHIHIRLPPSPHDITGECLIDFLIACANDLQTLRIYGNPLLPPPPPHSPILFRQLHQLTTDCASFPLYVTAPALRQLICVGYSYRFADEHISPEWRVSTRTTFIQSLELNCTLHPGARFDNWNPSSIIKHVEEFSITFSSELGPLLTRMASSVSTTRLFPRLKSFKICSEPTFIGRDDNMKVIQSLVQLMETRPTLQVSATKFIRWPEIAALIPANILDRIALVEVIHRLLRVACCVKARGPSYRKSGLRQLQRRMDRLPSELVAEFLIWGAESLPTARSLPLLQYRLAVSAVNVKWRAIALSTHRLWSLIIVDLYSKGITVDIVVPWLGPGPGTEPEPNRCNRT
ncbi:hypothetical protein DL93DRAFT_2161029 [Clavulina sp. PMI_390]|nr:hypothetical protein DL93DRAFT_2161029 [Clavulina sp. PMI_390]